MKEKKCYIKGYPYVIQEIFKNTIYNISSNIICIWKGWQER